MLKKRSALCMTSSVGRFVGKRNLRVCFGAENFNREQPGESPENSVGSRVYRHSQLGGKGAQFFRSSGLFIAAT
jgi:hypothetical protein